MDFFEVFTKLRKNGTYFLKKYFAVKSLRKKICGFTIIEILVVVSIIAALIGIAGKRLMPYNPLIDDDVLKIRDFIEKCVFECRTWSLFRFAKCKGKDISRKDVEFFVPGIIYARISRPFNAELYGKSSGIGKYMVYSLIRNYGSNVIYKNLCFEFPKLRKKITDIKNGVFIINGTPKFSELRPKKAERDISAGGFLICKKKDTFGYKNWNIFFDGFFAILDRPCFDVDDNKGILCWKVTFDNKEKWCFYVDDLCICHSVRVK